MPLAVKRVLFPNSSQMAPALALVPACTYTVPRGTAKSLLEPAPPMMVPPVLAPRDPTAELTVEAIAEPRDLRRPAIFFGFLVLGWLVLAASCEYALPPPRSPEGARA